MEAQRFHWFPGDALTGVLVSTPQVEKLKDVASEKGVDALKQAAEKGTTGVGHAAGFFSEVKRGFVEDLNAVASKLGKK